MTIEQEIRDLISQVGLDCLLAGRTDLFFGQVSRGVRAIIKNQAPPQQVCAGDFKKAIRAAENLRLHVQSLRLELDNVEAENNRLKALIQFEQFAEMRRNQERENVNKRDIKRNNDPGDGVVSRRKISGTRYRHLA